MRKGTKRRDWTVAEEQFLIVNAGKLPKRDICQMLRRSSKSVERKAVQLRAQGARIELRYHYPTLEPCPKCGCLSGTIDRTGMCKPCRKRDQLATIEARISDLMSLLPPEERDIYERTEAKRASKLEPLPEPPNTDGMSEYRKAYHEEAYAAALEDVLIRNLNRLVRAEQKRKERIERKVK